MTTPKIEHATIVVERHLGAAPARVFRAWADPDLRRQWDLPGEGWEVVEHEQDFTVGGREASLFGPVGGPHHQSDGRFLDIVQDARIVSAGTMSSGGVRSSATLCTIELRPEGTGTRLTITDQSVFLGTGETPAMRRAGWESIADSLGAFLAEARIGA